MTHEVVPLFAETRYLLGDAIPRSRLAVLPMEELYAAYAGRLQRLEIGGDTGLGRIAADDMEPGLRALSAFGGVRAQNGGRHKRHAQQR